MLWLIFVFDCCTYKVLQLRREEEEQTRRKADKDVDPLSRGRTPILLCTRPHQHRSSPAFNGSSFAIPIPVPRLSLPFSPASGLH